MSNLALIAIAVGNTRTHIALFNDDELDQCTHVKNTDRARVVDLVTSSWKASEGSERRAIAVASVNEPVSEALCSVLEDQIGEEVYRVGDDLPVPIPLALDPEATPGMDRLLIRCIRCQSLLPSTGTHIVAMPSLGDQCPRIDLG